MNRLRFAAFCLVFAAAPALAVEPPKQQASGPGGSDYTIPASSVEKRSYGRGNEQVYVFWPRPGAQVLRRPVIVFLHAYEAMSPHHYGAWIEHLVRRGNIVVYPRMQAEGRVPRSKLTENAVAGIRAGLSSLDRDVPGLVDVERVAYVGHAAGGIVAANLAAGASKNALPAPRLLFAVTPGNSWVSERLKTPLADLATLPASMLIVTVVASGDIVAKETDARKIIREASAVPPANKMLVRLFTDDHGRPVLLANHNSPAAGNENYEAEKILAGTPPPDQPSAAPAAPGRGQRPRQPPTLPTVKPKPEPDMGGAVVDMLDWGGYWKVLDLALEAAFTGRDTTPIKTFPTLADMGRWADGWPVKRLTFESARETPPAQPGAPKRP